MLVDINLMPQKERDRPGFLIAAILILLLSIIIWGVFAFLAGSHEKEQTTLAAQTVQVTAQQTAIRARLEAAQGMNEEQQLKATVDWAESYQFDTVPLLEELVSLLPQRGFFDNFSYVGLDEAVLSIQLDTAREAAYYLAQLKTSELIESVVLDSVVQKELEDDEETEEILNLEEDEVQETPRYIATYTMIFVDNRIPIDGTVIPSEEEVGLEEVEAESVEDSQVDVEINAETNVPEEDPVETAPEETGGDGQ